MAAHTRKNRRRKKREAADEAERLNTELFRAVRQGNVKGARALLEAGADANHGDTTREAHDFREVSPVLYLACEAGRLELVELLLAHGADPNANCYYSAVGERRFTPCVCAARELEEATARPIVEALVKAGADAKARIDDTCD